MHTVQNYKVSKIKQVY